MSSSSFLTRALGRMWPQQVYQVVRGTEKRVQVGFAGALVLLVLLGVVSYLATHKLRVAEQREVQLTMSLARLETLSSLVNDADDAQRGYVITGEERYLAPFVTEKQRVNQTLRDIARLTADYPSERQKIDKLGRLIAAQFAEFSKTIETRRSQGIAPAMQMLLYQEDMPLMDDIEQLIGDLRNDQELSLFQRTEESNRRERDMVLSITFGSVVAITLVAFAALLIDRDIRKRKQADENLRKSRDQLAIILQGVADGITVRDVTEMPIYTNEAAAHAFGYPSVQAFLEAPASEILQKLEVLDEFDRPLPLVQLPERRALRGEQSGEAILHFRTVATGEERWMIAKATPAFDESGNVQYAISIFHDITERVLAYRTLEMRVEERTREIERRRQVAEGLRDILTILNSNRPLDEILDSIMSHACELLGTNAGAVYRLEEQKELLIPEVARGLEPEHASLSIPAEWSVIRQVISTSQPTVVYGATPWSQYSAKPPVDPASQLRLADLYQRYGTSLIVPLMVKEEIYGAIALYYREPREFSIEETEIAMAFSDQAALAIENARLRVQAERVAVAAERSRLARDLHDSVTQTLFSTSMIADVLPRLWERNAEEAHRRLEELRELTHGALAEMRTLLVELRPATLTEVGLGDLLRLLSQAVGGRMRVPISLAVEATCTLPPDVQIALYRIAQEALNNVARHANARHIAVRLCGEADQIELRISDDGQGFEPGRVARHHLGLAIMRERAEAIGAALWIESQPGSGTQVVVAWPCAHAVLEMQAANQYHAANDVQPSL